MIAYSTLGTRDLPRATAFYDRLLGELGAKRALDFGRIVFWGAQPGAPMLAVCEPFDGAPASVGNGSMISLGVGSKAEVDRLHALALSLGGKDEGAPGARGPQFYIGYFRDLDGNKLNFFTMT